MAHVRKGQLTRAPQWWKHLKWFKRVHNKAERKEAKGQLKPLYGAGGASGEF